jgi:hypothetical protein
LPRPPVGILSLGRGVPVRKFARKNIAGFFVWLKVLPLQAMGYLSTLITNYYPNELPAWFADKYADKIIVIDGTLIASRRWAKIYDNEVFEDLQKALIESGLFVEAKNLDFNVAVLHEDGVMSKVVIYRDSIGYFLMDTDIELDCVWQG